MHESAFATARLSGHRVVFQTAVANLDWRRLNVRIWPVTLSRNPQPNRNRTRCSGRQRRKGRGGNKIEQARRRGHLGRAVRGLIQERVELLFKVVEVALENGEGRAIGNELVVQPLGPFQLAFVLCSIVMLGDDRDRI
jgi:hypothetical protein